LLPSKFLLSPFNFQSTDQSALHRARKTAKFLLKKNPSSLRLYNAYGLIEAKAENLSVSDHVFSTALSMSKNLPENSQRDSILLWHTWAWDALWRGDKETAMHRLLCIGESKMTARPAPGWQILDCTPAAILKARAVCLAFINSILLNHKSYHDILSHFLVIC